MWTLGWSGDGWRAEGDGDGCVWTLGRSGDGWRAAAVAVAVAEAEAGPGQAAKRKRQARGARREQRRTGVSAQEHGINTRRLACKNPASRQMWLDPHSDKSELENCQKIADSYQPSSLARRTTPSRPPSRSSPKRNNLYWYFVPTARAAQTWWISARMEARRLVYHLGCRRHHNHYPRYRMHRIISCLMPHASVRGFRPDVDEYQPSSQDLQ